MEKIGRQRPSESAWREILARQTVSGLTVQAFYEREEIKAVSFYGWRSRLREESQEADTFRRPTKTQRPERSSGEFIDLGALGSSRSRFQVRLDLGGGLLPQQVPRGGGIWPARRVMTNRDAFDASMLATPTNKLLYQRRGARQGATRTGITRTLTWSMSAR
jgi:hypothetical protein